MRKVMLTGDRPTGALHIGHYVGSIVNRLEYQENYESYFIIADLHTLTTKVDPLSITAISKNVYDMVLDYLACGIDPQKSNIYLQSAVSEISELSLILSMFVSFPRLSRIPSLKDMRKAAGLKEFTMGLLTYPVLQSADILIANANYVPVGRDNEAHIELTREIARKFNSLYDTNFFNLPEAIFTNESSLVGIYGKEKMSKSLNNAIFLSEDSATLKKKVMSMFTDPNRITSDVPGRVEGNPVFIYHDIFNNNKEEVGDLKERYKKGRVGDVEVKEKLYNALNGFLEPIRERREFFKSKKHYVEEVIFEGTLKMKVLAGKNLKEIKSIMGLSKTWNKVRRGAEQFKKINF